MVNWPNLTNFDTDILPIEMLNFHQFETCAIMHKSGMRKQLQGLQSLAQAAGLNLSYANSCASSEIPAPGSLPRIDRWHAHPLPTSPSLALSILISCMHILVHGNAQTPAPSPLGSGLRAAGSSLYRP